MPDRRWLVRAAAAVAKHPGLYPTAVVQMRRLAAPGWWRRRPYLPLPSRRYLHFRIITMYGGDGTATIEPRDVVHYLQWCRAQSRRS